MLARPVGDPEDRRRPVPAKQHIEQARAELVRNHPAGVDLERLQQRREAERQPPRRASHELREHEEDRQQVDEPERAERVDQRQQELVQDGARAFVQRDPRPFERALDHQPEEVEVGEVHDLAVEIQPPVAVDHERKEQARDHEEIGHAERPRERDRVVHEAFRARRLLDAQGGVHHHHHDDADALRDVDPVDARLGRGGRALGGGHLRRLSREFP